MQTRHATDLPGAPARAEAGPPPVSPRALAADLAAVVTGEVRFDDGSRALYAADASNYRQMPIGVVVPRSVDDIVAAVRVCRQHGAPVLPRGGGTSLAGQCCNTAVVLDASKHLRDILELDPDRRTARVRPGTVLDDLRDEAERHHLTFAPDPATHRWCTLGGMIGNNSCGIHSIMLGMEGRTADNVEALEVLTYDGLRMRVGRTSDEALDRIIREGGRRGDIYAKLRSLRDRYADLIRRRFPQIPRRVSGYGLPELLPENGFNVARALVGSEGTCVTVLEATLRLVPSPPVRALLVLGYPDVFSAADHVPEIAAFRPTGLEGVDERLLDNVRRKRMHMSAIGLFPQGGGWLLVEIGGETGKEADDRARELMASLERNSSPPAMRLFEDPKEKAAIWAIRESGLSATARVPGEPDTWPGWEDAAVPPDRLGRYLRDFRALLDRHGYRCALYGHFGQGCIHTRIDFDLKTADGIARFRRFVGEAADLVAGYGGSFSGEHGDGEARGELLPKLFGEELMQAFREFKGIWDPDWRMNPGKVIDAYPITRNLRLGTGYAPAHPATHFRFPDDDGRFVQATLRCVGVGECRKPSGGVMCPSYMVTREERHTTRGRAHLLFEMLRGDAITGGWRDDHVKDALHLCLACKGCKGECPMQVDLATYKAEFLSHYYAGRPRPPSAYAMGLVYWWSRLASHAPDVANLLIRTPGLSSAVKAAAGLAQERQMPRYARTTFTRWFRSRRAPAGNGRRVILWPDTFNNHFLPDTAAAAVEVLEAAGYRVTIPPRPLCCGRPLYDYGMLDLARRQLRQIMGTLRREIREGVPVVGLEPSCVAVFRDELIGLFPHDEDARRLSAQTLMLSELLERKAEGFELPRLDRKAIVQAHCHHTAIMGIDDERRVLSRLGLDYEVLDAGCCGMAGSFGYEEGDRYDVSVKAGERVLLPAVRAAAPDTLVVANGFSCREQIAQGSGREALHLSQVIRMAMRREGALVAPAVHDGAAPFGQTAVLIGAGAALGAAAALAGGAIGRRLTNRRSG